MILEIRLCFSLLSRRCLRSSPKVEACFQRKALNVP